jgi:hypothetical protein
MQRVSWFSFFLVVLLCAFLVNASQEKGSSHKGLEKAWSLEGAWTGVVSDKEAIYTLGQLGKCVEVDMAGKEQREIKIPKDSGSLLRIATLPDGAEKALLTFSSGSEELRAYDLSGKHLWTYPRMTGIDDVWARKSNGGESDMVIIGYNGNTGLHVVDGMGKLVWKSTGIGNVWHVCAGDVLGDGKPKIVTTSALGKVHIFDDGGKQIKELDVGCYANMVRIGKISEKDPAAMIVVAGSALDGNADPNIVILTLMSGQGNKKWSCGLPADSAPHVDSAQMASGKPWLAVGMRGGQVHVVDLEKGEIIASVNDQGTTPEVGWVSRKSSGTPLLLVATGSKLNAFRIAKSK